MTIASISTRFNIDVCAAIRNIVQLYHFFSLFVCVQFKFNACKSDYLYKFLLWSVFCCHSKSTSSVFSCSFLFPLHSRWFNRLYLQWCVQRTRTSKLTIMYQVTEMRKKRPPMHISTKKCVYQKKVFDVTKSEYSGCIEANMQQKKEANTREYCIFVCLPGLLN